MWLFYTKTCLIKPGQSQLMWRKNLQKYLKPDTTRMLSTRYTNSTPDWQLASILVVFVPVLYWTLSKLLVNSPWPLLITVYCTTSMIARSKAFARLIASINPMINKWRGGGASVAVKAAAEGGASDSFLTLNQDFKLELLAGIKSLQSYASNCKLTNERRRKLFRLMSWRQQKLCQDVGYLQKLKRIDHLIDSNQHFLQQVAQFATDHYGLSYTDFDYLKKNSPANQTSTSNYRVIETLGHFKRDWSQNHEIDQLLSYISTSLNKVISANDRANTCVVVAGSGLGRIAHEVATMGFAKVHAVEYSGLMHLCNQYIYSNNKPVDIYPHIHSCSNFTDSESQMRHDTLQPAQKPSNLELNLDDFRYFSIDGEFKNVVVVSAFFIDTAENLIDYFDSIQKLTAPSRNNSIENGYWINIGPLKYGTAAQVELNAQEIAQIRKQMGWNDLDYTNCVEVKDLVGYITDDKSFWQGYYGVSQWTTQRKENKARLDCK